MIRSCLLVASLLLASTVQATDLDTLDWVALPGNSGMEIAIERQDRGQDVRRFYLRDTHVLERWTMDCNSGQFEQLDAEEGADPVVLDPRQPGHMAIFRHVRGQLTEWLEVAMVIEKEGRPEVAATEALCRRLATEMTPETWLAIAKSVGGEYAREAETWLALSAWREMRCDADKEAQA